MATAPSRRAAVTLSVSTSNSTQSVTFTNTTDVQQGDLLVVIWGSSQAAGTASNLQATASSGTQTVVSAWNLDVNSNDGTRYIYIWSGKVTATPSTAVTVQIQNLPTTGTRRLIAFSLNPGTGQRWSSTPASRTGTNAVTGGGTGWSIAATGWASGSSSAPSFPVAAVVWSSAQSANTIGLDWSGGTTYGTTSTFPGYTTSSAFHAFYPDAASTGGYSTPTLQTTPSPKMNVSGATTHAAGAVLYVVQDPSEGRGNAAAKGSAKFTIVRKASGRGNAAAKGGGRGYKYTTTKTASGRGNAAAKGSAIPHPKTATGVARAAADGYSEGYRIRASHARGNTAAKGTGRFTVGHATPAQGNAAATGTGRGRKIVPIKSSARAYAAATAGAHGKYPYHPSALSDFTNTLILEDGASSTVITDVGITITHVADDGHTTTLESQ